jgi:PAS domain-containing protein
LRHTLEMNESAIAAVVAECFGTGADSIEQVDARAQRVLDVPSIVWEGDAQTFQFSYVSKHAEVLLGYPVTRWTTEPTFWADVVIAPDDRDEAIAYCALATAKRADHVFEYRARTASGGIVWLRDYVQVIVGPRRIATRLRGLMVDITAELMPTHGIGTRSTFRVPSHDQLAALA